METEEKNNDDDVNTNNYCWNYESFSLRVRPTTLPSPPPSPCDDDGDVSRVPCTLYVNMNHIIIISSFIIIKFV